MTDETVQANKAVKATKATKDRFSTFEFEGKTYHFGILLGSGGGSAIRRFSNFLYINYLRYEHCSILVGNWMAAQVIAIPELEEYADELEQQLQSQIGLIKERHKTSEERKPSAGAYDVLKALADSLIVYHEVLAYHRNH